MEHIIHLASGVSQLADAAGFTGLLGDALVINGQSIYSSYDDIGKLANALFKMAISIGAVIAVLQFVYGGIIYMMTESGAVAMGESKERMQNALLGLVMLLATYIVFNQINPDLLNLKVDLNQLPETQKGTQQ